MHPELPVDDVQERRPRTASARIEGNTNGTSAGRAQTLRETDVVEDVALLTAVVTDEVQLAVAFAGAGSLQLDQDEAELVPPARVGPRTCRPTS